MNLKKKEFSNLKILLLFLFLWFGFLFLTGTLFSGYHLIDDSQIVTQDHLMPRSGFSKVTHGLIENDLSIRFRPVYYLHRSVEIFIFHQNFLAWSIYTGLIAVATSFFFFLFCIQADQLLVCISPFSLSCFFLFFRAVYIVYRQIIDRCS